MLSPAEGIKASGPIRSAATLAAGFNVSLGLNASALLPLAAALSPDGTPFGDRGYKRRKGETMETDECGRLILAAVANRDRDLVMTWRGKIGRLLKLISPKLVDRIAKGVIESRQ